MKLTGILLLVACLQVRATGFSQTVSISGNNLSLTQIFQLIEKQTDYVFFFESSVLTNTKTVNLHVKDAAVVEVLTDCFKDQPVDFKIKNKIISIVKRESLSIDQTTKYSTQPGEQEVRGVVLNENGSPLAGASVRVLGLNKAALANEKGEFVLTNMPNGKYKVEISFVGYDKYVTTIEVLNNVVNISAALKKLLSSLDEAVVIAYGTTTKRLNTGSVSSVKGEDIQKQPVSNPLAAIEGRVPGLYIVQTSGIPGAAFTVRLRGQNSIINGNDPLYIVDGIPFGSTQFNLKSGNLSGFVMLQGTSPLNYINPSDIESVEVLKDADATAIYGSRGANGVILITTKKGKAGKTKVDLNIYQGIGKVSRMINLMNTDQYLKMRNEAFRNDRKSPGTADYDINGAWDTTRNTNWQEELIGGAAHYTDVQGNISGGNANTQFLFGLGYHRETTVFPGDNAYQKASSHLNLTHISVDQKFKLTLTSNFVLDDNNLFAKDLTSIANTLAPDAPALYNADGTLNWQSSTWTNPLSYLKTTYDANTKNFINDLTLSYTFLPGLQFKTSIGYTSINQTEKWLSPISQFNPATQASQRGSSRFANNNINTWIIEPQLSYKWRFRNNQIDLLVGSTFQDNTSDASLISASGFTNDALIENIAAAPTITSSNNNTEYKYNAIFGRINYNLSDKYLVNLTARRDGSSRFGTGRQFGNFGAIGAAWIFTREDFIAKTLPCLSFGKIKGSYGTTGNDQTGDYQFLDTYSATAQAYQGIGGLFPTGLFNADFGWETNKKLEAGIELGFLKDRILVSSSYYRNRSSNQLIKYPLPPNVGFTSIVKNLDALVQNTGVEFELTTVNLTSKTFSWTTNANISFPRNKLISFPNLASTSYANTYVVGQPLSIQKLYHYVGQNSQTGVFVFEDVNKDGSISSPADKQGLVSVSQSYFGGIANNFKYKNFQLDVFFQFVKQKGLSFLNNFGTPGSMGNKPVAVLNHWMNTGDQTDFGPYTQMGGDVATSYLNAGASDKNVIDASFVRLKNLSLSYRFMDNWTRKLKIQQLRLYIQGQNLFTITNSTNADPEQGNSIVSLPSLRVLTCGIQLTF